MNKEFSDILNRICHGEEAVLCRTVNGVSYHRRFIPKERLIILGGGHISEALVKIAVMLDFSVTVVDDRYEFANTARFPDANAVLCDDFESAIESLEITENDYICVVTRGHSFDKGCMMKILSGTMPYYLGMIGSHRKVTGVFESLREQGFDEEKINAVHAPIGPEIAVSICAELISCRRAKKESAYKSSLTQTEANLNVLEFLAHGSGFRSFAMILSSSGSTPAKSGALMAVDADGKIYGTIGGGCGEAQARRAAMQMLGTGAFKILRIEMDNEAAAEGGLVCGTIIIWIEDIKEDSCETY